jgi:hypothetical protein
MSDVEATCEATRSVHSVNAHFVAWERVNASFLDEGDPAPIRVRFVS